MAWMERSKVPIATEKILVHQKIKIRMDIMNRNQKSWYKNVIFLIIFVLTIMVLYSCASVPKEAVELNRAVGSGIIESQNSYTNLLNTYFALKKQQVDIWIENEYIPKYMANINEELKNAGQSTNLTPEMLTDILRDVAAERDKMQTELEKTRILLLTKSNEHFTILLQSNTGVTNLLQSMIDVEEATSTAIESIKTKSGGKVDLEIFEKKFNEYLEKAGATAEETTNLYDNIKTMFEKEGD